jgi:hypothetical protein
MPPSTYLPHLNQYLPPWGNEILLCGMTWESYVQSREWNIGYRPFRDWDANYEEYEDALKFSEVVKGTTVAEKDTNTIVENLPLKIHVSDNISTCIKSWYHVDCKNRSSYRRVRVMDYWRGHYERLIRPTSQKY